MTKEYHTGSSQYASAESDIESDASIGIQRMSLGPSGSAHLLDRAKGIEAESRSAAIRSTGDDTSAIQGHLLSYIDNAMERFEQIQRSQAFQAIYHIKRSRFQELGKPTSRMSIWNRSDQVKADRILMIPEDITRTNRIRRTRSVH